MVTTHKNIKEENIRRDFELISSNVYYYKGYGKKRRSLEDEEWDNGEHLELGEGNRHHRNHYPDAYYHIKFMF